MKELNSIIEISKKFGEDTDMVQGGGGNTSVKIENGKMYVKASGTTLRLTNSATFIPVDVNEVLDILNDKDIAILESGKSDMIISEKLKSIVKNNSNKRPSIETFLHALLGKYVVHVHPVYVNALTCLEGGEALADKIFKGKIKYLWIGYDSPGYPLGVLLRNGLKKYVTCNSTVPEVIFLQNHGIIISSDDEQDIYLLNDKVIKELKGFWGTNLLKKDVTIQETNYINLLKRAFTSINLTYSYLQVSKSRVIRSVLHMGNSRVLFTDGVLYPDQIVYCGECPLYIERDADCKKVQSILKEFIKTIGYPPKVIIFDGEAAIFSGESLDEIKAIEETLEAHLKVLLLIEKKGKPRFLSREETIYIANWESEKYRKKLIAGNS